MTTMQIRIVEDAPKSESLDLDAPGSVTTRVDAIPLAAWRAFRAYDRPDVYDIAAARRPLTDDDWAREARQWADESVNFAMDAWDAAREAWDR